MYLRIENCRISDIWQTAVKLNRLLTGEYRELLQIKNDKKKPLRYWCYILDTYFYQLLSFQPCNGFLYRHSLRDKRKHHIFLAKINVAQLFTGYDFSFLFIFVR